MPENIKALIVILGLSIPVFWIAKKQICDAVVTKTDFDRRRNLWLALTASSFLANNFWLYAAISCVLIWYTARHEKNSIALFLFVVFAVPPISVTIPGLGGIQHIFSISHIRMLSVIVLVPAYLRLRNDANTAPFGKMLSDKFLLAYIIFPLLLQINVDSATNTARFVLYSIVDVFLPYYVASRSMKNISAWRDTMMSLMTAIAVLSVIAIFEYSRKWALYGSVSRQLGIDWDYGKFMLRGDTLRAMASSGHAIALGYILMIGLAFFVTSKNLIPSKRCQVLFGLGIIWGLLGTAARGPWVGAFVAGVVLVITGKNAPQKAVVYAIGGGVIISLLAMSGRASEFLDYLPFVGTNNSESIVYRQQLIDVSIQIIKLNPILGSFDYIRNPLMQQMIQGEGIIDIVNTYIGIALTYGLLGLTTFVGIFISCAVIAWKSSRLTVEAGELNNIGRSLLAALAAILISIATCSSVAYVALLYWIVAGFCVGYAHLVATSEEKNLSGSRSMRN